MAQARLGGWLSDPDRITNRGQLAEALKAVKGERSYAQLDAEAERLIGAASARRGRAGEPRSFEPLRRGSVSDWLLGRGLPTRNKLVTFLAVCDVPANQWPAWDEAVVRARRSEPVQVIAGHDPLLLGVHPAIQVTADGTDEGRKLDVLTPYVTRDHDHQLREVLRTGQANQMVVLVGGSSVGKTRACVEAVREVLPGWAVVHPDTAEELLAVLEHDVVAGTVLWLNETQRYLQPPHGNDVAIALRRLLVNPAETPADRVVVLGSMWLDPYWWTFTRQPQDGEPDIHAHVRELLTLPGLRIRVAEDFSTATDSQRAEIERLAVHDPRLATALAGGGELLRITQTLAGGPLLLRHYTDLGGSPAHAVLTAAMDARRIGYEAPLSAALLEQAASGYLTPEQRATTAGWLRAALTVAAEEIHGVRALIPVRTGETIGEADGYLLHDFLVQHALSDRRREPIPASLWEAVTRCIAEPDDLRRVADNAHVRGLVAYSLPIYRTLTDAGDQDAAESLAALLVEQGDEAARAELQARADTGDLSAAECLAEWLVDQGDEAGLAELRARADAGDRHATTWLADLLVKQGDRAGAMQMLRPLADGGARDAAERLAKLLVGHADEAAIAELRARADAGDQNATTWLAEWLVKQGDRVSAMQLLWPLADAHEAIGSIILAELLAEQGDLAELRARVDAGDYSMADTLAKSLADQADEAALAELRVRAGAGDLSAAERLAEWLVEQGDEAGLAELRVWADAGNRDAGERLAWWLAEQGDEAALAELRDRAGAGDREAADWLADLLVKQGDRVGAMQVLRPLADAHEPVGSLRLADLLVQQGDQAALAELRDRADAGNWDAANRLAKLLVNQGDTAGLRRELYAGNTRDAAEALANLYAAGNPDRRRELKRHGFTVTGHPH